MLHQVEDSLLPSNNFVGYSAREENYEQQQQQTFRMSVPIVLSREEVNQLNGIYSTTNPGRTVYDDHSIISEELNHCDDDEDLSPEEQQRCPTMMIHLKGSNGIKRKILQDITWDLYHYDGLMMSIGKLFPQEQQVKVSYAIGKSPKIVIRNDQDWQHALQQLLLNDETILKIFIKSHHNHTTFKKKKNLERIVHKHEKFKRHHHFRESIAIDTSNIRNVFIDAGDILLHVRDLKSLALNSEKDIAEKTLLQLARSFHQTESFEHVHVFFNSTMNVQPEENEAGTFVVSIAEAFSTSGDLMVEFLNRQIIAGALESCLVVSYDRVLLKDLNVMGVKVCNARSWFKICQSSELTNSKDWLRNIISEITSQ